FCLPGHRICSSQRAVFIKIKGAVGGYTRIHEVSVLRLSATFNITRNNFQNIMNLCSNARLSLSKNPSRQVKGVGSKGDQGFRRAKRLSKSEGHNCGLGR
ncbi:MAG: hypothetical protein QGG48_02290, partial [Desulfatiglandales bacterium]|nr:hypothetical protein [Desulfatiglandales bacterium]